MNRNITYLTQGLAQAIDFELMSPSMAFSIDQLMELAGLSVAQAAMRAFPLKQPAQPNNRVLICCGPGNNGGDGLVAARHLALFGYTPVVVYPKQNAKPLFCNLLRQLEQLEVPVITGSDLIPQFNQVVKQSYFIIDAIFGFSFFGPIKPPFDVLIHDINESKVPVLAVDMPSGWHVEKGYIDNQGIKDPAALISLTAPKLGTSNYTGVHYVGGRFVPGRMARRMGIVLAKYPGSDQIVQL